MSTIPASYSVESTPSVISAGGNALNLNGLLVTKSARVPIGSVLSFPTGPAVSSYFGAASSEAVVASGGQTLGGNPAGTGYFGGYENATAVPGALLVARYPATAVAAWLRGGTIPLTLAQLQALSGSLTVVMDGYSHVISSISFASDNSFSAAAAAIQAAFTDPTVSNFTASLGASFTGSQSGTNLTTTSVTGLISIGDTISGAGVTTGTTIVSQTSGPAGGAGVYVTSVAGTASTASCTSTSNVLDVTVDTDNAIAVGQTLSGSGITGSPVITALISGTGGDGTYLISGAQQNVASEAMTGVATAPLVTFDSVSGAFLITSGITGAASTAAFATGSLAASLMLTSATGAVLSQGSNAMTPAAFMASIIAQTTNWASFFTNFDPDGGSGNSQKLAFAAWTNSVSPRYVYICWDTDITPTESVPATTSLGYLINTQNNYSGTCLIWTAVDLNHAPFISGAIAAINFNVPDGRITFAYKTQPGLEAAVDVETVAVNLGGAPLAQGGSFGNGYNFVGAFATANQKFVNFQRGTISGPYEWLNSYVFQIWLTNMFQLAGYEYMTNVGSFAYNPAGYASFESAMQGSPQEPGPIQQGLTFGAYAGGVTLSASEALAVNNKAGKNIAGTLQTQGWYFQCSDPGPQVRASRGSPNILFFYVDEGDVQALNIGAVEVQ